MVCHDEPASKLDQYRVSTESARLTLFSVVPRMIPPVTDWLYDPESP